MTAAAGDRTGIVQAEHYLRVLWNGKWLIFLVVAACMAGAEGINLLLPKTYQSLALLSVRSTPALEPSAMLFDSVLTNTLQGTPPSNAIALVRRFGAIGAVTLAARDVGAVAGTQTLDNNDVAELVRAEAVGADLIALAVNQPTAERARRLAERIVARATEQSQSEMMSDSVRTQRFLADEVSKAERALHEAEGRFIQAGSGTNATQRSTAQQVQVDRAKMELDLARDTYASFRKRLVALDLILTQQQPHLYVVDPPTLPKRPIFPRPILNLSIGLTTGVIAGILLVVLREAIAESRRPARGAPQVAAIDPGKPMSV